MKLKYKKNMRIDLLSPKYQRKQTKKMKKTKRITVTIPMILIRMMPWTSRSFAISLTGLGIDQALENSCLRISTVICVHTSFMDSPF